MRIAVPVANDVLCPHFGQCTMFALFDVDPQAGTVLGRQDLAPPRHEPGVYPRWLHEQGATLILAGGLGSKAQRLFAEQGIEVVTGVGETDPALAAKAYLEGRLEHGANRCDH
ncbi:MAG: ATPase [Dactylosporangium sp.]|nr:NifB/NifX family molybdenum-iron cluster-binding protein [Dactylosporangium sp.]NNJ59821.1 ATPase [Dactylosporangium sp.]